VNWPDPSLFGSSHNSVEAFLPRLYMHRLLVFFSPFKRPSIYDNEHSCSSHQIACFKATEGFHPPYRAALSHQHSVASFATLLVQSCLQSHGLRCSCCNVVQFWKVHSLLRQVICRFTARTNPHTWAPEWGEGNILVNCLWQTTMQWTKTGDLNDRWRRMVIPTRHPLDPR
jgi:hypothetical protein